VPDPSAERRRKLTLAACIIGSSLAFVDATVVIVALPTIEADLDLGLSGQQWVFLSYSLALAALYLVGGAVGDRFGRRRVFAAGVGGFALASALAGAAPSGEILIVARFLQGVAGAFLTTNSLALLRAVYAENAGRAIGLWTSFTSVTTIAGPPLGGALAEWASWRWIFFVNLPLAGLAFLLVQAGRDPAEQLETHPRRLDVRGAVLAALGLGTLTYGAVEGAENGLADQWWAFAIAAVALSAFVVVERRAAEPMIPFALFRHGNLAAANAETFLVYASLYGFLIFFTLFLQSLGFTPFEAGLITTPTSLVMIALAARFGTLADRHGPRLYLTLGPALIAAGILLTLPMSEQSDFWTAGLAGLLVFSLGLAMMVAPITATALKSAPAEMAGVASGVNSTVSRLGSLTAAAVIGIVIGVVYDARTDDPGPALARDLSGDALAATVSGYRAGMLVAAGLAIAGALVGAFAVSNREAAEGPAPPPEARTGPEAPAPAES
jgi:EmrB/QacA subfamily drug resistance transporter